MRSLAEIQERLEDLARAVNESDDIALELLDDIEQHSSDKWQRLYRACSDAASAVDAALKACTSARACARRMETPS